MNLLNGFPSSRETLGHTKIKKSLYFSIIDQFHCEKIRIPVYL